MNGISSISAQINQGLVNDGSAQSAAGVGLLKKALNIEAESVLQLVQTAATPPVSATRNPDYLGQNVDVRV